MSLAPRSIVIVPASSTRYYLAPASLERGAATEFEASNFIQPRTAQNGEVTVNTSDLSGEYKIQGAKFPRRRALQALHPGMYSSTPSRPMTALAPPFTPPLTPRGVDWGRISRFLTASCSTDVGIAADEGLRQECSTCWLLVAIP